MDAYTIRDAAEQFGDLIGRAEAGESIDIARDGHVVARLVPASEQVTAGKRFDLSAYFESIKDLPVDPIDSVAEMRRQARY